MFSLKIAILGCARDCASYLPHSLRNVAAVAQMFTDYRFLVYENDSADATLRGLREFALKDPERRQIQTARFLSARIPGRTRRLAYVRQQLQRSLWQSGYRPDVVMVMDLDDAGAGPTPALIEFVRAATLFDRWDAAFPRLTYDLAAWRQWPPGAGKKEAEIASRCAGPHGTRVASSFNGVGVYKAQVFFRGRYIAPGQRVMGRVARPGPCEHITFHASLGPSTRLAILNQHAWP